MTLRSIVSTLAVTAVVSLSAPTCRQRGEKGRVEKEAEEALRGGSFIALQPFGHVPEEVLSFLEAELPKRFFGLPVRRLKPLPIPEEAFDPQRCQYRADHFLIRLNRPKGAVKVLGLVDKDLYTPGLNFVFGQAALGGVGGVVALVRLRPEFWGEKASDPRALFLERVLKEAVHELGHTFGLDHCPNPSCVMRFSNTIWDTDRKRPDFCERCRASLMESLEKEH